MIITRNRKPRKPGTGSPGVPRIAEYEHIGMAARIYEYRINHGMVQKQMAEYCGVSTSVISRAERNDMDLSDRVIAMIANAMGVTPQYLKTGENYERCDKVGGHWKVVGDRGRMYCPYCGKVNGWRLRDLLWDSMPIPRYCGFCGGEVLTDDG